MGWYTQSAVRKECHTNLPQTLLKNRKEVEPYQPTLWDQYCSDIKSDKHIKRKEDYRPIPFINIDKKSLTKC